MSDSIIFDSIISQYRNIHNANTAITGANSRYFTEFKVKYSLKLLGDNAFLKPINILDFGCGDGLASFYFSKYCPKSSIHGVDISQESVKFAQKKNINRTTFVAYNGSKLPYRDNSFDFIYASCVVHHLAVLERFSVISELYRVLKKNGVLHIYEHNPVNPFTRYFVSTCMFDKGVSLIPNKKLHLLLRSMNLFDIRTLYIFLFPRWGLIRYLDRYEHYFSRIPIGAQYLLSCVKR